jgi:hypothetical protein
MTEDQMLKKHYFVMLEALNDIKDGYWPGLTLSGRI